MVNYEYDTMLIEELEDYMRFFKRSLCLPDEILCIRNLAVDDGDWDWDGVSEEYDHITTLRT
jgi:hypothetical protein